MTSLRGNLIRLAHENPKLKKHLVPMLKTAASGVEVLVDFKGDSQGKFNTTVVVAIPGLDCDEGTLEAYWSALKADLVRIGTLCQQQFDGNSVPIETLVDSSAVEMGVRLDRGRLKAYGTLKGFYGASNAYEIIKLLEENGYTHVSGF